MSNVIEIEHLYKEYRLGLIGYGTLREDLQSWWAKARGKEDPNSILFSGDQSHDGDTLDHILALNDINLTVERGERLGIIGKNGAGKTTLLKILSRIASPTKGTARIRGRVASLIAVGTGFHGELTGRENIYLNGSILGLRNFEIDKQFDEIVDFSGVEQFIDTPVKRYSSGMYVRLGFAVAAHLDPDVLIVDEVLAVGDVEFRKKALGKMKDVSKGEGRTVLFVSHNMTSIANLCEQVILLHNGKIEMKGKTEEVISHYLNKANKLSKIESSRSEETRKHAKIVDVNLHQDKKWFLFGEKIKIDVTIEATMDFDNVYLNGSICDILQNPIGVILHKQPIKLKKGESKSISLIIGENSGLIPNDYYISLTLKDSRIAFGRDRRTKHLDSVSNIKRLTILQDEKTSRYINFSGWKKDWGSLCLISELDVC